MLISFYLKKFWLKGTGQNGVPLPIRKFNFDEVIEETPAPAALPQANNNEEIEALKKDIAEIKAMLEANKGGNPA